VQLADHVAEIAHGLVMLLVNLIRIPAELS
jgi:hypothetical protein